jgi:hypothetical protein
MAGTDRRFEIASTCLGADINRIDAIVRAISVGSRSAKPSETPRMQCSGNKASVERMLMSRKA